MDNWVKVYSCQKLQSVVYSSGCCDSIMGYIFSFKIYSVIRQLLNDSAGIIDTFLGKMESCIPE